jgi:class 3 adenylate cyclase
MGLGTDERRDLPTGTVTFLRSDVEGSMELVRALGSAWDHLNTAHLDLIRAAVEARGGTTVRTEGDAFFGAFPEARAAVLAAIDAQRALLDREWEVDGGLRVRMGLHSGEAHLAGDDYGGFEVNRAARIAGAGHGGQIVLSEATRGLANDSMPDGVLIRDLGLHALKGVPRPERLFQLDVPGLRTDFPPLRTAGSALGDVPVPLTSFVGRRQELAELLELGERHRLLTLDRARRPRPMGPGSSASTRSRTPRSCVRRSPGPSVCSTVRSVPRPMPSCRT